MTNLKSAVDLLSEIFQTKRNVDAAWKVVYFDATAKLADNTQDWVTSEHLSISTATGGGTNYEAGLIKAQEQLATTREGSKSIVIFLTDGEPTYYVDNTVPRGYSGNGGSFDNTAYNHARAAAANLTCDSFYAIGVDFGSTAYTVTEDGRTLSLTREGILQHITAKVPCPEANKKTLTVNSNKIVELFKGLAGTITTDSVGGETKIETRYDTTNVTITDPLSEYVEFVPKSEFYVSIEVNGVDIWQSVEHVNGYIDENGIQTRAASFPVEQDGQTYMMEANIVDGAIVVTFPDGYKMYPDYTYKVGFMVRPTAKAYDEYLESGYNAKGEEDTDNKNIPESQWTSVDKPGFNSNEDAKVNFTYKGVPDASHFKHPVVQVHFKNEWEIYKVNGDGTLLNTAEFKLQETDVELASALTYTGTSQLVGDTDGYVKWTLGENETIARGKTYNLTETKAPTGYVKSEEHWLITISDENVPTVIKILSDGVTEEAYTVEPVRNKNVYTYKFYFVNSTVYSLPSTGGDGIYKTTFAGIVMMLASVYMCYRNRRKQRVVR